MKLVYKLGYLQGLYRDREYFNGITVTKNRISFSFSDGQTAGQFNRIDKSFNFDFSTVSRITLSTQGGRFPSTYKKDDRFTVSKDNSSIKINTGYIGSLIKDTGYHYYSDIIITFHIGANLYMNVNGLVKGIGSIYANRNGEKKEIVKVFYNINGELKEG